MSNHYGDFRTVEHVDGTIEIWECVNGRYLMIPAAVWREMVQGWAAHYKKFDDERSRESGDD